MPVEVLFPEGPERFELGSSGWAWGLGIDAVAGSPHGDFADHAEGCASGGRLPGRSLTWARRHLGSVVLDLVGEVGD